MKNALEKILDKIKFTDRHEWMIPAAEAFGKNNGMSGIKHILTFLILSALQHYGYFEHQYKPGLVDKPVTKLKADKIVKFDPKLSGKVLYPKDRYKIFFIWDYL
jgi:hypothetical protein